MEAFAEYDANLMNGYHKIIYTRADGRTIGQQQLSF